ncbi:hypothetical protein CCR75_002821 [Bremia lactucae]|uniref:Reverse transcriptase RNase H-like domain-containing protein n=1 Tax=Bremia lactucae TaxID=4779 RepID=A0A976FMN2_BRELC|nr:hypothetical protein CCR75_002821 [Bremia lactucae]
MSLYASSWMHPTADGDWLPLRYGTGLTILAPKNNNMSYYGCFEDTSHRLRIIQKEAYQLIWACRQLTYLLVRSAGFHLFCDHKSLVYMFSPYYKVKPMFVANYNDGLRLGWLGIPDHPSAFILIFNAPLCQHL